MAIYDDKTQGIVKSGNYFFINDIKGRTEAVFKASYIVGTNLYVKGKIEALFDLIVIGNIEAQDIEVKGNLTCLGNCNISNSITVQGKVFGKCISANRIEIHDDIVANEIDADTLNVDGSIIVGQTLAVSKFAKSGQKILCGETAYGAGKLSAYEILTGEKLDMDDGVEAYVDPNKLLAEDSNENQKGIYGRKYAIRNDYNSYLNQLEKNEKNYVPQTAITHWKNALNEVYSIIQQPKFKCYDIGLLLMLIELSNSVYFDGWEKIAKWRECFLDKFNKIANGEVMEIPKPLSLHNLVVGQRVIHKSHGLGTIKELAKTDNTKALVRFDSGKEIVFQMDIALRNFSAVEDNQLSPEEMSRQLFVRPSGYGEWVSYLNTLRIYRDSFSKKLYDISIELLYASIGVKSKFITERLKENGWSDNE